MATANPKPGQPKLVVQIEDKRPNWKGFELFVWEHATGDHFTVMGQGPRGGQYPIGGLQLDREGVKELVTKLVAAL